MRWPRTLSSWPERSERPFGARSGNAYSRGRALLPLLPLLFPPPADPPLDPPFAAARCLAATRFAVFAEPLPPADSDSCACLRVLLFAFVSLAGPFGDLSFGVTSLKSLALSLCCFGTG